MHLVTPTEHLAGFAWSTPEEIRHDQSLSLSLTIDIPGATQVFFEWLVSANPYLPADEAAFAEALISETRKPWHVLLMVDFIASAYRRHLAKQAA